MAESDKPQLKKLRGKKRFKEAKRVRSNSIKGLYPQKTKESITRKVILSFLFSDYSMRVLSTLPISRPLFISFKPLSPLSHRPQGLFLYGISATDFVVHFPNHALFFPLLNLLALLANHSCTHITGTCD